MFVAQQAEAVGHVYTLCFKQNGYDLIRSKQILYARKVAQLPCTEAVKHLTTKDGGQPFVLIERKQCLSVRTEEESS